MARLGIWSAAMVLAAALTAPATAGTPTAALETARASVIRSFLGHAPGQPTAQQSAVLASGVDQDLQSLIQQISEIQLGCAAPCDTPGYTEGVRAAAQKLRLNAAQTGQALERYAPGGQPRLRVGSGNGDGQAGDGGPQRTDLQSSQLSDGQRTGQRGTRSAQSMADSLRLDLNPGQLETANGGQMGTLGTGGTGTRRYGTRDAIAAYTTVGAGGSQTLLDRRIVAPPTITTGNKPKVTLPTGGDGLSMMQRAALWAGDRISPTTLQNACDFSAGLGDTLSFGATKWIRKKMGTDGEVREGSTANMAGNAGGIAVSMFIGGGVILKPFTKAAQVVTRWAPAAENGTMVLKEGQFVMAGQATLRNKLMGGIHELKWKYGNAYDIVKSVEVPGKLLRYPIKEEGLVRGVWKGLMGQRVYVGPTVPL